MLAAGAQVEEKRIKSEEIGKAIYVYMSLSQRIYIQVLSYTYT